MNNNPYQTLENKYKEISLLYEAMGILSWDRSTFMPNRSIDGRTDQLTNLYVLSHNMLKKKDFSKFIKKSEKMKNLNKWQSKNINLIKKEYLLNNILDEDLLKRISIATSDCEMEWRNAKQKKSFKAIIPKFKKVVKLRRIESEIKSNSLKCSPYDALLNDYESGLKSKQIDVIFDNLTTFLPEFLKEVLIFQSKNKKIVKIKDEIDHELQKKLGQNLMEKIGFDFSLGRLDVSLHPFCGGAYQDARITTRYNKNNFIESLMGVLHETGHAMYNLGLPKKWKYQPVGDSLGTVVHESQSLFMEMQICRSLEFLKFASPIIKKVFKKKGGKWNYKNLYKIYTYVQPSFIRVDADEVTYPLHVILRYKIEKELIEGNIKVEEIPKIWNSYMKKYLNIIPKHDSEGCLQDIHWFDGTFGYFPTYTLGALYAAQLSFVAKKEISDFELLIENGRFNKIIDWLGNKIHSNGSLYNSNELINKVSGEDLNIDYFKKHLINRYLN